MSDIQARRDRDRRIRELHSAGWSDQDLAEEFGLSRVRIVQIRSASDPRRTRLERRDAEIRARLGELAAAAIANRVEMRDLAAEQALIAEELQALEIDELLGV